ncbi:MAG: ABC transporter substrate-binding protein [Hyphomicrobiales bacterium]|nr:ABC transporter substrate-binding protein [Hyphomicrobiales bacterium]
MSITKSIIVRVFASALVAVFFALQVCAAQAQNKMRIAFAWVPAIESLHFLAAIERARERGVDIEVSFKHAEDLAFQAVVKGEADIGIGTPYLFIQLFKPRVRMFVQLSRLRFFPVVNSEFYQTWEDLNGQEVAVQGRGTDTETIMKIMAEKHGITYKSFIYGGGSKGRVDALLLGKTRASILSAFQRHTLEKEAPGKFKVLPLGDFTATDEALFANIDYLAAHADDVDILVEELLLRIREIADDPSVVVEMPRQFKLLAATHRLTNEEILAYFKETAEAGALPVNGGGTDAAEHDFEFYSAADQLRGEPSRLNVADFWDLGPLERVLQKLGTR